MNISPDIADTIQLYLFAGFLVIASLYIWCVVKADKKD